MDKKKAVFNWSGGKDSALALHKIMQDDNFLIVSLLTTVNSHSKRSSMHGIPLPLLEQQAKSIGLPLYILDLTPNGDMSSYQDAMVRAVEHFAQQGVSHFVFGDIFLHDVRSYRQKQLAPYAIEVIEPLWGRTSEQIMEEFIASGLQTVVVTLTQGVLDKSFLGRKIDRDFIRSLPSGVDVCGENGEYHTFCYAGPLFSQPIDFSLGEPLRLTYPVNLDDGTTQEYCYWFAQLSCAK